MINNGSKLQRFQKKMTHDLYWHLVAPLLQSYQSTICTTLWSHDHNSGSYFCLVAASCIHTTMICNLSFVISNKKHPLGKLNLSNDFVIHLSTTIRIIIKLILNLPMTMITWDENSGPNYGRMLRTTWGVV